MIEKTNRKWGHQSQRERAKVEKVMICKKFVQGFDALLNEEDNVLVAEKCGQDIEYMISTIDDPTEKFRSIHSQQSNIINKPNEVFQDDEKSLFPVSFPTDDEVETDSCSICLETFYEGDEIGLSRNVDCNHVFHKECLIQWLMKNQSSCPICMNLFYVKGKSVPKSDGKSLQQDKFREENSL